MRLIIILLIAMAIGLQAQDFKIQRIDSAWAYFVTTDTLWSPDSVTHTVNIRKDKMTINAARNQLYAIADNQKRILEAQAEAETRFTALDSLLKEETGLTHAQILSALVLKELEGDYVFTYSNVDPTPAKIAAAKLIINDKQYTLRVNDRLNVVARDLMGAGEHVRLKRKANGLAGKYGTGVVALIKKE